MLSELLTKMKYALLGQKPRSKGVKVGISGQIGMSIELWHKCCRNKGKCKKFCTDVMMGLTFIKSMAVKNRTTGSGILI